VEDGLAASGWCALVIESGALDLLAGNKEAVVALLQQHACGGGGDVKAGKGLAASPPPSVSGMSAQMQFHLSLAQMQGSVRCCMNSLSKATTVLESLPGPTPSGSVTSGSGSGAAHLGSKKALYQLKPMIKACRIAEEGMATACSKLHASLQAASGGGGGAGAGKRQGGGDASGLGRGGGKASSGQQRSSASTSCQDLFQVRRSCLDWDPSAGGRT
jgi:hypothetical protein